MRARPVPRNFASGELAPWLDGLPGDVTKVGCLTCENYLVKKQGQITRWPGTFYVNEVKTSANSHTILVPVTIDDTHSYVLEIGDAYTRFYTNHARITYAGTTTIYEVTSPWSTADLTSLRWVYIPNEKAVRFTCANGNYPMQTLAWTSDASWTLNAAAITGAKQLVVTDKDGKMRSTKNGTDWDFRTVNDGAVTNTYGGLAKGKNRFVMIQGASATIRVSDDAIAWSAQLIPGNAVNVDSDGDIIGTEFGVFAIAGTASGTIYTSESDGTLWTTRSVATATAAYNGLGIDREDGLWRAAGKDVGAYSTDGITWSSIADITGTQDVYALSYGGGTWLGVGNNGIAWTASSVGAAWSTSTTIAATVTFYCASNAVINGVRTWVAGGKNLSSPVIYKTINLTTWSLAWTGEVVGGLLVYGIRWYMGQFWAFTNTDGKLGQVRSYDGATWTRATVTGDSLNIAKGFVVDQTLKTESFDQSSHYPELLTAHEGRLVIGPTKNAPSSLWGSGSTMPTYFYLGDISSDAWSYALVSEKNIDIQWIMGGMGGLIVGTRTAEGMMIGSPDEGITPLTAQFRWLSTFGSDAIQPVRIHDTIIFVQRGGEILRAFVPAKGGWGGNYIPDIQAFSPQVSFELTAFADHIASGGIVELDLQSDPQYIVYAVRNDGQLLALTMDNQLKAWARRKMASSLGGVGAVESIAVIPTSGAEDEVWAVVRWTISGATKRYIVYFDTIGVTSKNVTHQLDCGYYNATPASATVYNAAVPQLASETVWAVVNGNQVEKNLTAGPGGTVTIATAGATSVHIGLPYTSKAQTMRIDQNSAWGSGLGLSKRLGNLNAWVSKSIGGAYGPNFSTTEPVTYTSTTDLTTDLLTVNYPGQWDRDGYICITQTDPLPHTVVAVAPDLEMGDR